MTSTIKLRAVPPAQRAHSEAWMREWAIEAQLSTIPQDETPVEESAHLATTAPTAGPRPTNPLNDPAPAPGQIRLLHPGLVPTQREPVYVAIMSDWEDDLLLVAPFSGFQHPATRGEWLTGRPEPPLAVLCAWGAVSVSPFLLAQSWHAGDLSLAQREAAWHVFRHAATGAPIPEALQDQVGAPIIHPLDPRIRYQSRMTARMAPLVQRTARLFAPLENVPNAETLLAQAHRQMRMAAQDRGHAAVPLLIQEVNGENPTLHVAGEGWLLAPFHAVPDSPAHARGRMAFRLAEDHSDKPRPQQGDLASLLRCAPGQPEETLATGSVLMPPKSDHEPFCMLTGAWDVVKQLASESASDLFLVIFKP